MPASIIIILLLWQHLLHTSWRFSRPSHGSPNSGLCCTSQQQNLPPPGLSAACLSLPSAATENCIWSLLLQRLWRDWKGRKGPRYTGCDRGVSGHWHGQLLNFHFSAGGCPLSALRGRLAAQVTTERTPPQSGHTLSSHGLLERGNEAEGKWTSVSKQKESVILPLAIPVDPWAGPADK